MNRLLYRYPVASASVEKREFKTARKQLFSPSAEEWQAFSTVRGHGLYDTVFRGDREGLAAGSKIILPRTSTGGPRRDIRVHVMKGESKLDNCNVVPYNCALCLAVEAYIYVQYYGRSMLIKCLFKYISKGHNRILAKISNSDESTMIKGKIPHIDEIQNYVDGRFICPYEACWRIFDFLIHSQEPAVQILNVHLENMQRVNFCESDRLDIIVNLPEKKKTTLTEWFVYNIENTDGRHLTYLDFPSEFVWYVNSKRWQRRQVITKKSLGRLTYVHLSSGYLFYFRMLLCHRKGCLLGDDKEWDITLEESTISATSKELRILFSQIHIYCDLADPLKLWIKYWEAMGDDISAKISRKTKIPNYHVNSEELQGYILYELEKILNGFGNFVTEFGLQPPPQHLLRDLQNKLLMEEKNYKHNLLREDAAESVPKLNHGQRKIFDLIISASITNRHELLFIYGHGGTGKTFLWRTIISSLRSKRKIFLAVASSGITSLLLPAGRTAHSRFKFPVELSNESLCHAKKKNRTLRDLMSVPNFVIRGSTIVLGGDFHQTLPVKKGASKEELIIASIAKSHLWPYFKVCTLKENMRLLRSGLTSEQQRHSEQFAKWILDVVIADEAGMSELIDFIYDDTMLKAPAAGSLQFRTMSAVIIASLRISQENCILEAKVYQRWISKSIPKMKALAYCCILIDRENNAIQTTTDINSIDYFSQLLKLHVAYRISNFIYERTKPYQQTLENQITLRFGKIRVFEPLPGKESEFPDHHFKLISYHQLSSRVPYRDENSKLIYPILTDYLGCVQSINNIVPFGTPTRSKKYLRKVDIEDLNGNIVEFTMCDELAKQFDKKEIKKLTPPIIIAVSSCRVTKYKGVHFTCKGMITSVQENRDWKTRRAASVAKLLWKTRMGVE
ncbi:DNA helicase [Tanacetum coccineum]